MQILKVLQVILENFNSSPLKEHIGLVCLCVCARRENKLTRAQISCRDAPSYSAVRHSLRKSQKKWSVSEHYFQEFH